MSTLARSAIRSSNPAPTYLLGLGLLLFLLALPVPADAATLGALRGKVVEREHRRDVTVSPHWIEVVDKHTVSASRGEKGALTALYDFSLPRRAAIVGLTVGGKSRGATSTAIDADAAARPLPNAIGVDPDLALLRQLGEEGELADYQLVLHPVTTKKLTFEIRWVMPTSVDAGLVSAHIPTRADSPTLKGTALFAKTATSKVGRLVDLRVDGKAVGQGEVRFDQSAPSITVQARLQSRGSATRLSYIGTRLGGNLWALTIAGASPSEGASSERFANLVVVIDASKSMSDAGLAAARQITLETISKSGDAHVDVVVYDREARSVLGGLKKNNPKTREAIRAALGEIKLANGSNLRGGIHKASALLAADDAVARAADKSSAKARRSAIVVLSDGQFPLSVDADDLREAAGDDIVKNAIVFAVDIAGENNPLPSPPAGALGDLILRTGGRTFSVRASRASSEAARIVKELGPAPQLGSLKLEAAGKVLTEVNLPESLASGSGFMSSTLWLGDKPPRSVTLRGVRGGAPEVVRSSMTRNARAQQLGASLALREVNVATIDETVSHHNVALVDSEGNPSTPQLALSRIGARLTVVTPFLSLVIPHQTSRFARERMAFAKKWGTELYLRAPVPGEEDYLDRPRHSRRTSVARRPTRLRRLVRNGGLDRTTLGRTIQSQLFRPVRHCYERALRRDRSLEGTVRVRFEIARTEVVDALVTSAGGTPDTLRQCILEAAFQLNVPAATGDGDTTYVVTYPFRLRPSKKGGRVDRGSDAVKPSDPLENL